MEPSSSTPAGTAAFRDPSGLSETAAKSNQRWRSSTALRRLASSGPSPARSGGTSRKPAASAKLPARARSMNCLSEARGEAVSATSSAVGATGRGEGGGASSANPRATVPAAQRASTSGLLPKARPMVPKMRESGQDFKRYNPRAMALLETLEIDPAGPAEASVVWLHGLGADGHDFEGLVPELR